MQTAIEQGRHAGLTPGVIPGAPVAVSTAYSDYKVIRRNGAVVGFEPAKVSIAMTNAFLAVSGAGGGVGAYSRAGFAAGATGCRCVGAAHTFGWNFPYRRHSGSGRVGVDASPARMCFTERSAIKSVSCSGSRSRCRRSWWCWGLNAVSADMQGVKPMFRSIDAPDCEACQ